MAAINLEPGDGDLAGAAAAAHAHASRALSDSADRPLAAVFWLSTHLAAMRRVVHPAARAALRAGRSIVVRQQQVDRRLEQELWLLDRRLTGEAHAANVPLDVVVRQLRAALAAHVEVERQLVWALEGATSHDVRANLALRLAHATSHAPTRPHPMTPHPPGARGALFRLDALADHVRDVLDNRHIPAPRSPARRPRVAGRWGLYLLGTSAAETDHEERADG